MITVYATPLKLEAFNKALEPTKRTTSTTPTKIRNFLRSNNGVGDNYDRLLHTFQREYGLNLNMENLEEALAISYDCISELNVLLDQKVGRHDVFNSEKCSIFKKTIMGYLIEWQSTDFNEDLRMDHIKAFRQDFKTAIEEIVQINDREFNELIGLETGTRLTKALSSDRILKGLTKILADGIAKKFNERNPFI